MAFMMPVVKNNYEIYPAASKQQQQLSRTRRASSCRSSSQPGSRTVSESAKSNVDVILSPPSMLHRRSGSNGVNSTGSMKFYSRSAPVSTAFARPPSQRTVRFIRSASQESNFRKRADSAIEAIGSSNSTDSSASNMEASALAELTNSPKASGSFSKFHARLVNKLKRKLGIKDDDVCVSEDDATVVRSST